jgi:hypothetical protein
MTIAPRADDAATLVAACYRSGWRTIVGLLVALSRASILLVLARLFFGEDPPTVLPLVGLVLTMIAAPELAARGFRRASAATVTVEGDAVVITRRDARVEIPRSALVAVVPWALPLPTPGAALRLRSGGRLGYELGLDAPSRLAAFLAEHADAGAFTDRDDPGFAHADAAAAAGTLRWWQWVLKFPLFGLVPTVILFRAHQWITYGGTFGQYYTYGARPYVLLFLDYWTTVTVYLSLWAGLWRVIAEIVAWIAARLAPSSAAGVRRFVEIACRVAYYGGVPLLLALRFAE